MPQMQIKIDAGIGDITVIEPENLKLKMLVDALKDHIEIYGLDGLTSFLSAEEGMEELKNRIDELEKEVEEKDGEIEELESVVESEDDNIQTIDCGIGSIHYEADNIALQDLMENLSEAITKNNHKKVNEVLFAIT